MKSTKHLYFSIAVILAIVFSALAGAQTVIPQIADGGGWRNYPGSGEYFRQHYEHQHFVLSGTQPAKRRATSAWPLTFLEVASTQNISLAAGGTLIIHSAASAPAVTVGWAQVSGDPAIVVYAVFTQLAHGTVPDQDCTVLAWVLFLAAC